MATTIVKIVFAGWTGTNPAKYLIDDFAGIFSEITKDYFDSRRLSRIFESMVDEASKYITSRLEFEVGNIENIEALEYEVYEAIYKSNLSARKLADLSYNENAVTNLVKANHELSKRDFSSSEIQVYHLLVDITAKLIVDFSTSMPDYAKASNESMHSKLDIIDNRINELIKRYNDEYKQLTEKLFNSKHVDFGKYDINYCESILRIYDKMELIGVKVERKHRKYQLSTSFVQLGLYDDTNDDEEYEESSFDSFELNSIESLLEKSKDDLLIIGDAGTGKSTILKWIAVNTIRSFSEGDEDIIIPLILELRSFNKNIPLPENYFDLFKKNTMQLPPSGWIESKFKENKCILLLDGIDEISSKQRIKILDWVEELKEIYNIRIIATSRPSAKEWRLFRDELNFTAVHVANMNYRSICLFSERWHSTYYDENQTESNAVHMSFIKKISTSKSLMNLASNPLLCAILCALNNEGLLKNDSSRKELYEDCISMLLDQRDSGREISTDVLPELTYSQKRALLDDLSYWMVKNGYVKVSKKFTKEKFKIIATNFQSNDIENDVRIDNLIERNGILREKTNTELDFIHKSFMEFMAASQISKESDWELLSKNLTDDLWTDVAYMSMCFASESKANMIIDKLLTLGIKNTKYNFIAMECLKRAVSVDIEIQRKVNTIIKDLIPPKSQSDMVELISAENHVVPFLEYQHGMSNETIRLYTKILSEIPTRESYAVFIDYLNYPIDAKVYEEIISQIGSYPNLYHFNSTVQQTLFKRLKNFMFEDDFSHLSGSALDFIDYYEDINYSQLENNQLRKLHYSAYKDHHLEYILLFKDVKELILNSSGMSLQFLSDFKNLERLILDVGNDFVSSFSDLKDVVTLKELIVDLKYYTKDHGLYTNTLCPLNQINFLVFKNINNVYLLEEILREIDIDNNSCIVEFHYGNGILPGDIEELEHYFDMYGNRFKFISSSATAMA